MRHLGRLRPPPHVSSALPLAAAVLAQLPPPPDQVILTEVEAAATYSGTLGNTTAGDCTIAGVGHLLQRWSLASSPAPIAFTDAQALAIYSQLEGYDPATGQPDNGLMETDVLAAWTGGGLFGNRAAGYATVSISSVDHIKQTIDVYGGIYLGLDLPRSAEEQTDAGVPWTEPWFSPILGGHCVAGFEYDPNYLYVGTWGIRQPVAWSFVERYFDAAYAVADAAWLTATGRTAAGLDLSGLVGDLPAVAN